MDDKIYDSCVLSISQKNLNCNDIVKYFCKERIMANITKNDTILCDNNNCWPENGCRIIINQITRGQLRDKIWIPLQKKYDLKCAHLNNPNKYQGCIHNFFSEKKCP